MAQSWPWGSQIAVNKKSSKAWTLQLLVSAQTYFQTQCLKTNFDKFSVSNVEGTAMHINKHGIQKHWTDKHGIPKCETKLLFDWNENIYWSKILPPQYYRICFHISCIKHASITNISIVQMSDFQQNHEVQSGTDFLRNILYTLSHYIIHYVLKTNDYPSTFKMILNCYDLKPPV